VDLGEGAAPYAPFVEAIRRLVRDLDDDDLERIIGPGRSELARLVPDLGPAEDDRASGLNIDSAQGRLFELLLGVLQRLADRGRVLLVVEDLHWSDRSTRDLLAFLVRNLRQVAVTMVATYRSDELHRRHPLLPFIAELERTGWVERLELHRFDRRDAAAQLRAIAGRELDAGLIRSIHARAGGNAFFAEELLAAAGEDGRAELPATLRDVLLARVAGLADSTQEFLRIASAAGQRVDPALLAAAAHIDEGTLYDALREAVGRQVLVADQTTGVERYAFRHALLQEAIYDDLLPGERTRLHSAFARTLEARTTGDASHAAELAYHWYAAHDLPRALESAVIAGQAAKARYAFPEAVAQFERAIDPTTRDRSRYEYRIARPDGTIRWVLAHGEAVFEGEGEDARAIRYAGTIQDISAHKAAERHQQILIAELNHRVKNMLAIVQAIAHQTFKHVGGEVADTFYGRLSALSAAHTILTRQSWEAADVGEIASAVLRPHAGDEKQIRLSGDEHIRVPPQIAVNLAMALHELATNAAKYGALSSRSGRVDVSWTVTHSEPMLHISWRESGGPEVRKPEREGFGTRMLQRVLASELGGKVKLEFNPAGLECSIEAPLNP
jgi:two-component sensor histidine kinase